LLDAGFNVKEAKKTVRDIKNFWEELEEPFLQKGFSQKLPRLKGGWYGMFNGFMQGD
jgi:hypothetical protein